MNTMICKLIVFFILYHFSQCSLNSIIAPGKVTLMFTTNLPYRNGDAINLSYTINNVDGIGKSEIINSLIQLKSNGRKSQGQVSFDVTNIAQKMEFQGSLKLVSGNRIITQYQFLKTNFQYDLKYSTLVNGEFIYTKSMDSTKFNTELEMKIKVICLTHYYPANICTKKCIEMKMIEKCDTNGYKKCSKGFYLNQETQSCDNDWCTISSEKCQNNGKCKNEPNGINCHCPATYRGKFCEIYVDLCLEYKCPNNTKCIVDGLRVKCINQLIASAQISTTTIIFLVLIMVCVAIISISIALCSCFKCQNKSKKSNATFTFPPRRTSNPVCDCSVNANSSQWDSHNYFYSLRPNSFKHTRLNRTLSDQVVSHSKRLSSSSYLNTTNSFNHPINFVPQNGMRDMSNEYIISTNYNDDLPQPPTYLRFTDLQTPIKDDEVIISNPNPILRSAIL